MGPPLLHEKKILKVRDKMKSGFHNDSGKWLQAQPVYDQMRKKGHYGELASVGFE